jgi:ABC-2 type transport system permease protein
MRNLLAAPIRASAFWSKEIYEILRQPGLIVTLALGPFLILLLFGVGFSNQARPFRTLFVAPESDTLSRQIEAYATTLGDQLSMRASGDEGRTNCGRVWSIVIVVPRCRDHHQQQPTSGVHAVPQVTTAS